MAAIPSNVLVIDDDPIFQAVAESVLLSLGSDQVWCASDGNEGLHLLATTGKQVDLIILDLNMPGLDGLGFLRAVAVAGFNGAIVISSGEAASIVNAARHLADRLSIRIAGTLKKPITPEAVKALLAGQRQAEAGNGPSSRSHARDNLRSGGVVPYYQPQFDLVLGRTVGVEALARFHASDGRVLGPGFIFDQISSHGELMDLTKRIITAALQDLNIWRKTEAGTRVSLNLDMRVLEDASVCAMIDDALDSAAISPEAIVLEMTETALPVDMSVLIEVLTRLRMRGYGISMDDYGTGGASFELLRICPFSELKIDQTIVQSAEAEPHSRRFIEFCVKTAEDLDLELIAEGIETPAQRDLLVSMGVHRGQGFLMSRPVPAQEIPGLVASGTDKVADRSNLKR